jgi:hypothetical protein
MSDSELGVNAQSSTWQKSTDLRNTPPPRLPVW